MSLYNQETNADNVIFRYILISLIADLRSTVYIYNQVSEDELKKVIIPFYHSVSGNERFLLDNFLYDAIDNDKAIGDYETVPRGVLQLSSLSIDSGSMVNKFVPAEFTKNIGSEIKTFLLNTNFIPISISFDTTIVCSNFLEMLKSTESVISKLYKSNLYQVDLGMFRVEISYQIPEDYSQERLFDFNIDDKKEFNITFPIEVKTSLPVFENGILLPEINEMINNSGSGIGMYRNGEIRFGGIFQEFDTSINDISISPIRSIESNQPGSVNNQSKQGKVYSIDELTSRNVDNESGESKSWRNENKQ